MLSRQLYIWISTLFIVTIIGCNDEIDDMSDPILPEIQSSLTVSEDTILLSVNARYYRINAERSSAGSRWDVESDVEWITLSSDTLHSTGILEFYAEENDEVLDREATITFVSEDAAETVFVTIQQAGTHSDSNNRVTASMPKVMRVGWGYDIFGEYNDGNSVTELIIDYDKLAKMESESRESYMEDISRNVVQNQNHIAHSLSEMQTIMTSSSESSSTERLRGSTKTVKKYENFFKYSSSSLSYAYCSYQKIVATRLLDYGFLEMAVRQNLDIFTKDFALKKKKLEDKPTDEMVEAFVSRYGTHLVVAVDLGGSLDYMMSIETRRTNDLEGDVNQAFNAILGQGNEMNPDFIHVTEASNRRNLVKVNGGSEEKRKALENALHTLSKGESIKADLLNGWMETITNANLVEKGEPRGLGIVASRYYPIWDLLQGEARRKVHRYICETLQNKNIALTRDLLRAYEFETFYVKVTQDLLKFDTGKSLVKVIYLHTRNAWEPLIEICNEYVPEIRSDKRVNILYPIVLGKVDITSGIFIGDGEGSCPSYVAFKDDKVFVKQIPGYSSNGTIKDLVMENGYFYPYQEGQGKIDVNVQEGVTYSNLTLLDVIQWYSYPIVKIGSGYWTRNYVDISMDFENEKGEAGYVQLSGVPVVFCYYYGHVGDYFIHENSSQFLGSQAWSFPHKSDFQNMYNYIGNNAKYLFYNQITGFDAEFYGYYGKYDNLTGAKKADFQHLYYKKNCFLPLKDSSESGSVVSISTEYKVEYHDDANLANYYPIRLFRSSDYTYPDKPIKP